MIGDIVLCIVAVYLLGRIDMPWPDPWEKNGKEAE